MQLFIQLFVLMYLLSGCISASFHHRRPAEIAQRNDEVFEKEGLYSYGAGGGVPNTVRLVSRSYVTNKYQFTSIDETRVFIVGLTNRFAAPYNTDKEIRPYLQHYPFGARDLDICVRFFDKNGDELEAPYLSYVSCYEGNIRYFRIENDREKCIFEETFDRAQAIAESAHQN